MTPAPAVPRDDQAVEQVFDLALEQMLDGDVTCWLDDHAATHRFNHHGCTRPDAFMCDGCTADLERFLAAQEPGTSWVCRDCERPGITLGDLYIEAV